jgi:DNA-binding GntR family transcriptional regulator
METLATMRSAADLMRDASIAGNYRETATADDKFHSALLQNCGNPYLINAYKRVSGKVAALRSHRSNIPTRHQANGRTQKDD